MGQTIGKICGGSLVAALVLMASLVVPAGANLRSGSLPNPSAHGGTVHEGWGTWTPADTPDPPNVRQAPTTRATAGALAWEDRFDASGFEQAFSVVTLKGRVFTAGFIGQSTGRDFLIRAHDAGTGTLLWQDRLDMGHDDFASGVTTDGSRVFVSGVITVPGRGLDWMLRAYDPVSGRLLWQDIHDVAGATDIPRGTTLTAAEGRVFLGGYGTAPNGDLDWILRAHDAVTGALVWQDHRDDGGEDDGVYTMAVGHGGLVAGGWGTAASTATAWIRVFDPRDGALRWEHGTTGAPGSSFTYTRQVTTHGDRLFAAQVVARQQPPGVVSMVRSFDLATGAVRWTQVVDSGGGFDLTQQIAVEGGRVYAAGVGCTQRCHADVRSYRAATGRVGWARELDLSTGRNDEANLVTAVGGTAYVLSQAATAPLAGCCQVGRWVLSALDGSNGDLLWQDLAGSPESGVYNMVVERGRLFVPGRAIDTASGDWDHLLRAYDIHGHGGTVQAPPPESVALPGTDGQLDYGVVLDGLTSTTAHGLVPAQVQTGIVANDDSALHTVTVLPGTRHLTVALFDEDTDGQDDLDLYLYDPLGRYVAASYTETSTERIDVPAPRPGAYTVVLHAFRTDGPDAAYDLSSWAVGGAAAGNVVAASPDAGRTVELRWAGLTGGTRYMGAISYQDANGEVGQTVLSASW